jgi:hypothetical protein
MAVLFGFDKTLNTFMLLQVCKLMPNAVTY